MEYAEKLIYVPKSVRESKNFYPNKYNNKYNSFETNRDYNNNYKYRKLLALKKLIFPPISEEKLPQLMIDNDSIKFITFHNSAQEITNVIMNNLIDFPNPSLTGSQDDDVWLEKSVDKKMNQLVITEMTAGVGGNVFNFAKYFKYVNAIEINPERFEYLEKNIKLYELDNINCYNDDSLNLLVDQDDINQDIIFFDPPWGGVNYKLSDKLRLNFGEYSVENVCKILFKRPRNKMIVMKLPNNYDFDFMRSELKEFRLFKFCMDRMTIVIVKNY